LGSLIVFLSNHGEIQFYSIISDVMKNHTKDEEEEEEEEE
jgi:hypothetical protein